MTPDETRKMGADDFLRKLRRRKMFEAQRLKVLEKEYIAVKSLLTSRDAEIERLTEMVDRAHGAVARKNAEIERANKALDKARLALEHSIPSDCYSTGPLMGTIEDHLCIACETIAAIKLKKSPAQPKEEL